MVIDGPVPPLVSIGEAQSFLRVEGGDEEALIAGLIRTATAVCEQFIGHALIAREFCEIAAANGEWQRLRSLPVRSIGDIRGIDLSGRGTPLSPAEYNIDIDADGRGWVRCYAATGRAQIDVRGMAGSATDVNAVPEPLRQGVLRLVAHLFAERDGAGGEPPAAVTALWRPYRKLSLAA